jgi:hypothetical protein
VAYAEALRLKPQNDPCALCGSQPVIFVLGDQDDAISHLERKAVRVNPEIGGGP